MDFQDIVLQWADDARISLQNEYIDLSYGGEWSIQRGYVSYLDFEELEELCLANGLKFERISQDEFGVYMR